jgi:hypothetical protein
MTVEQSYGGRCRDTRPNNTSYNDNRLNNHISTLNKNKRAFNIHVSQFRHFSECHYSSCRYSECRGATVDSLKQKTLIKTCSDSKCLYDCTRRHNKDFLDVMIIIIVC